MLMDHGTPWWGRHAPQGLTRLALWLIRQGVELHFSRVRHPQTQGKVERFHGELQRAVDRRGAPAGPAERQSWLDEYRWEHNHLRPHQALGMAMPASRWQPSQRRYDPRPAQWQYSEGARVPGHCSERLQREKIYPKLRNEIELTNGCDWWRYIAKYLTTRFAPQVSSRHERHSGFAQLACGAKPEILILSLPLQPHDP
jgi:hypothetical protein